YPICSPCVRQVLVGVLRHGFLARQALRPGHPRPPLAPAQTSPPAPSAFLTGGFARTPHLPRRLPCVPASIGHRRPPAAPCGPARPASCPSPRIHPCPPMHVIPGLVPGTSRQ